MKKNSFEIRRKDATAGSADFNGFRTKTSWLVVYDRVFCAQKLFYFFNVPRFVRYRNTASDRFVLSFDSKNMLTNRENKSVRFRENHHIGCFGTYFALYTFWKYIFVFVWRAFVSNNTLIMFFFPCIRFDLFRMCYRIPYDYYLLLKKYHLLLCKTLKSYDGFVIMIKIKCTDIMELVYYSDYSKCQTAVHSDAEKSMWS